VVRGSMPIAPFENNLAYRILDQGGNQIGQGSFLVTAADPGGPATFESPIDLAVAVGQGTIRLELIDQSMADGAIIALDSVVLKAP